MSYSTYNPHLLDGIHRLHFIGVGGSGMYPLVQIMHKRGYQITGSDVEQTKVTDSEQAMGIKVFFGHAAENIGNAQMIVYSAAIHEDNPEMQAAHAAGIPCIERSILLGFVSRVYEHSVCISGTHGKTTTTSMFTTMLELAGRDPGAVIGGKLPLIGGYGKAGSGESIVIESCEYSETFLNLAPTLGVVLNIDNDHLEYYGTMENLKQAFRKFALLSRTVCYNADDANTCDALAGIDRPTITFGITADADYKAVNIQEYKPGFYAFDVLEHGAPFAHLKLGVPGRHNVYNALSLCCGVRELGLVPGDAVRAAANFTGAGRRFQIKGECNGAPVVDDYAHHPAELRATLSTARAMGYKRIIAVHQPFTYSRTKALMNDFAEVLSMADQVVLLPIMGSREVDDGSVRSEDLAAKLPGSVVVDGLKSAADWVKAHARPGDLVVCMSCGDLYKACDMMVE